MRKCYTDSKDDHASLLRPRTASLGHDSNVDEQKVSLEKEFSQKKGSIVSCAKDRYLVPWPERGKEGSAEKTSPKKESPEKASPDKASPDKASPEMGLNLT